MILKKRATGFRTAVTEVQRGWNNIPTEGRNTEGAGERLDRGPGYG